jgi:hypothetical protein
VNRTRACEALSKYNRSASVATCAACSRRFGRALGLSQHLACGCGMLQCAGHSVSPVGCRLDASKLGHHIQSCSSECVPEGDDDVVVHAICIPKVDRQHLCQEAICLMSGQHQPQRLQHAGDPVSFDGDELRQPSRVEPLRRLQPKSSGRNRV